MTVPDAKRLKALDRAMVRHWSEDNGEGEWHAEAVAGGHDARHVSDARVVGKKVVGPVVQREAVAHLRARMGLSERRACQIVGADRKMIR
jgi:hypothetical protein